MRSTRAPAVMAAILVCAATAAGGESLWSPDFRGYLSGSRGLAVGQSLVVQIDDSTSLTFSSSSNDSKNLTMEFTGGESGNIFSFLPQVRTGGTLTTTGKDSLGLKTQIPVVVTAVNPDGSAAVQGSRTVAIQGKNESITISGTVPAGQPAGAVSFSRLANARLTYATFLASAANVLSPADLVTPPPPPAASAAATPAAAGTAAPAAPAGTAAAATPAATSAAGAPAAAPTGLTIPDARKKQLLLQYLNRLVDVIFAQ